MRAVPAFSVVFILFGSLLGCGSETFPWEIRMPASVRDQAASVEASIAEGSCATPGNVVYRVSLRRGEGADPPQNLAEGSFAFFARVLDDSCNVIAEGCVSRSLPIEELVVDAASVTASPQCGAAACDRGVCTTVTPSTCAAEGCIGVVQAVSAGRNHTCAINAAAELWCWGRNAEGQLGIEESGELWTVPRRVNLTSVDSVAAGGATDATSGHTCAISAGELSCWGDNTFGQLGTMDARTPTVVAGLPGPVIAVAAGGRHSCAIVDGGELHCFGDNREGQLDGEPSASTGPVLVPAEVPVTSVALGDMHSCSHGESTECWGSNESGRVGRNVAGPVTGVSSVNSARETGLLAVGGGHAITLATNGIVRCWGNNENGQCTGGENGFARASAVDGIEQNTVVDVAAGGAHSCAVRTDRTLICWGQNQAGQLGVGGEVLEARTPELVESVLGVAAVSTGGEHSCAIDTQGTLFCWGQNRSGQLGIGTEAEALTPMRVMGSGPQ
ncbi:MAG: hypothetical protein AAGF12_01030 [Myxococcota bacterium]